MAASSPGSRPGPSGRACGPVLTPAAGAAPTQQAEARIKIYNATRSKTTNLGSLRFQGIAATAHPLRCPTQVKPPRRSPGKNLLSSYLGFTSLRAVDGQDDRYLVAYRKLSK